MRRASIRRAALGIVCAAVLPAAAVLGAGFGLMVGIDNYDPRYVANPLESCVNDAYAFREKLLSDSSRWQADKFTLLTDSAASKTAIRSKMASLAAAAVAGDVVVYFQSSHGGQNSGTDTYLCTYNASYQDEELASDLAAFRTGVSVIIVIDACHSAGMFKDASGTVPEWNFAQNVMDKMQALKAKSATALKGASIGWITAADYNEYSLAGDPYSLFVGYVLDGFQSGDADANGQVTFLELYTYAAPLAVAAAALDQNAQHPQVLNTSLLGATVAKGVVAEVVVPLADALDAAGLTWTTGGAKAWYGQTAVSYDGADAGRNGDITDSQESWMQTTVTGPGVLSYKWKVSSERNYDFLTFYYDGAAQGSGLSGETNWTAQSWAVPAGAHTAKWVYAKDGSASSGSDCGWVDQVTWQQGYTVIFDAEGGAVSPASKVVYNGGTYGDLPTPARANYVFGGWWTGDNGTGTQVSGDSSLAVNANHTLYAKWIEVIALDIAADATERAWATGGGTNWFGQRLVAHDGVDAAQSGPVAHAQQTWVQTAVTGPLAVTFWWKVSSEDGYDNLIFYIDDVEQTGKISGETDWQQKSYLLSGGTHTLKWAYAKDGSVSRGSDCGWVDQVVFCQGAASFTVDTLATAGEGSSGEGEYSAVVPVWGEGPVSVTVSAVAASAASSDFVFDTTGAALSWALGESGVKYVTVPIKGDTAAEGNEVFYLALGSPWGGPVGGTSVCAVVICDDDGSVSDKGPYVSGVPVPPEGGRVTGGGYCPSGKTVTLTAAANAGWTFLSWENGYQGTTRSVAGEEAAEAAPSGALLCRGLFKRSAEVIPPEASNPGPQEALVGVGLNLRLPIASECLPKVTVSGLPSGLALNASTASIVGVPKAAGTYAVTFTASNVAGPSASQTFALTVVPLPAWAQGAFNGFWRMPGDGGASDGGTASMTVTSLGKVSGKLSFRGTNYTFSATSYAEKTGGALVLKVTAKSTARTTLPLTFQVWQLAAAYEGGGGVPENLGAASADMPEGWVELYRNVWKDAATAPEAATYAGYYTATLPGNGQYGSGYLALTVDRLGNVKTSGKLADGTTVSSSGALIWGADLKVYAVLYAAPMMYKGGTFFGAAEFVKPDDGGAVFVRPLEGWSFLWKSRNPQATGTYGEGFQRNLGLTGGWYDKVGNLYAYYTGAVLTASAPSARAPEITANSVRYESVWWSPDGVAVAPVLNSLGVMTGLKAPAAGKPVNVDGTWAYDEVDNTVGMIFTLTRATGLYRGSFKAWFDYGTTHTSKSITFQGALTPVRETPGDGCEGRGYFLWADKGAYVNAWGSTSAYTFKWSYNFLLISAPAAE